MPSSRTTGVFFALAAYIAWGLSPLFWKQLAAVPPAEIVAFRVPFALAIYLVLLLVVGRFREYRRALGDWRLFAPIALAAMLLSVNWLLFVWAVFQERMVEASLGYFINPLVNVFLGVVFLREKLRPAQWLAVALAVVGVSISTWSVGHLPWISLGLAGSFGIYGLLRKTAKADALLGSNLEMSFLLLPAILFLAVLAREGEAAFPSVDPRTKVFLYATGLMTALPLLWFSAGARRLPLSTMGFFQYLAPTGQLLLAVFFYGEPFSTIQLLTFGLIWIALIVFTVDAQQAGRAGRAARRLATDGLKKA